MSDRNLSIIFIKMAVTNNITNQDFFKEQIYIYFFKIMSDRNFSFIFFFFVGSDINFSSEGLIY